MKNYNKDYPPIDCDCGCEETVKVNIETIPNNWKAVKQEAEYDLCCKKCGKYLGHFIYEHWEY